MNDHIPQPAATPETLRQNIDEHIACAQDLLQVLARENAAVLGGQPEELEQVAARKGGIVSRMQQLSQILSALSGPGRAPERLMRSADLQHRWQTLMTLAARCQKDNLANGALLEAKQSQVRWALGHMLGASSAPSTYGRGGIDRGPGLRRIIASA